MLKASLALQHGEIAPNLHLDRLHPAVQPFYSNLEIPTQHCPWPTVESGGVKRASVNSFGFRGAVGYTFASHRVAIGLTIPRMPTQSWRHTNNRMEAKLPLPLCSLPLSSLQAQNGLSRRPWRLMPTIFKLSPKSASETWPIHFERAGLSCRNGRLSQQQVLVHCVRSIDQKPRAKAIETFLFDLRLESQKFLGYSPVKGRSGPVWVSKPSKRPPPLFKYSKTLSKV